MTRAGPPRGRRPGGPDTRGLILDAARHSFAARGFGSTTIRAVAAEAGVDPALVHHYFGAKDDLFLAALDIGVDPRVVVPAVFAEGIDGAGERLVRLILTVWEDPTRRLPLLALVRAGLAGEPGASLLRDGIVRMVLAPLRAVLPEREAGRRSTLVASQVVGLVVARYLLGFEPLASMPGEQVVAWLGPTLQRYLTGPEPLDGAPPHPHNSSHGE